MPEFAVKFRNRLSTHCVNTQYPFRIEKLYFVNIRDLDDKNGNIPNF